MLSWPLDRIALGLRAQFGWACSRCGSLTREEYVPHLRHLESQAGMMLICTSCGGCMDFRIASNQAIPAAILATHLHHGHEPVISRKRGDEIWREVQRRLCRQKLRKERETYVATAV